MDVIQSEVLKTLKNLGKTHIFFCRSAVYDVVLGTNNFPRLATAIKTKG